METSQPVHDPGVDDGLLRAAFREVHGRRLHGFALLVTLGDRPLATRLAREALIEGTTSATSFRHPERAASWLRHRVLAGVRRRPRRGPSRDERRSALFAIGVDDAGFDALARLTPAERATLVAGGLEGLTGVDMELILGSKRAGTPRRILELRRRFMVAHLEATARAEAAPGRAGATAPDGRTGPLAERIRQIAGQALATRSP